MRLYDYLTIHNIKIKDFADKMGVSDKYIYALDRNMTIKSLIKICKTLKQFGKKITPDKLLRILQDNTFDVYAVVEAIYNSFFEDFKRHAEAAERFNATGNEKRRDEAVSEAGKFMMILSRIEDVAAEYGVMVGDNSPRAEREGDE